MLGTESEQKPTTNSFIERQKARLLELEAAAANPPDFNGNLQSSPQDPPTPPLMPDPGLPSQVQDSAPLADVATLQTQLADLEGRYRSEHGRLEPTQRALSAAQSDLDTLRREVADLRVLLATPPPPELRASIPEDDQELADFVNVYGDMAPGLEKFVRKRILDPMMHDLEPVVRSSRETAEQNRILDHRRKFLAPVVEVYPNAANTINSKEFQDHLRSMPAYVAKSVQQMLLVPEAHDIEDVKAIFADFASRQVLPPTSLPPGAPAPTPGTLQATPRTLPTSLSPGNPPAPVHLTTERMAVLNRALTRDRHLYAPEAVVAMKAELEAGEVQAIAMGRGASTRM